eukprot:11210156-Lingulodinium_polyedra.AAC.1
MHALGATRATTECLGASARVGLLPAQATLARAAVGTPDEINLRLHGPVELLGTRVELAHPTVLEDPLASAAR